MIRSLSVALALLLATGCTALQKERRLAQTDQAYRVTRLLVLPVLLPYRFCPEDVDKLARNDDVAVSLTTSMSASLGNRGYPLVRAMVDPDDLSPKQPFNKELGRQLCSGGGLEQLPPAVVEKAKKQAALFKADQVLVSGFPRLRWHLKTGVEEDNGVSGDRINEFTVRAVAALYDVKQDRVVWTDYVDTKLVTGSYDDAIKRVLLFDQLRGQDPHEKLFYDFPLAQGAAAPPQ